MAMLQEIRRKLPVLKNGADDPLSCPGVIEAPPSNAPGAAVVEISVDDIIPNRAQPRTSFHQHAIARLADSIRRYGVLQPLTVRKVLLPPTSAKAASGVRAVYELVAGERRLRAAKLAELTTVPCIVINTDDATSAELAIVENLLREDLNMFEQAEAFQRLIKEFHLTQDEAARRVSMSQSAIANKLRILRLLPEERQKILQEGLTERHARALLKLNDPALRGDVLQHILDRKLNVSATEAYIDNVLTEMARYQVKMAEKRPDWSQRSPGEAPITTFAPSNAPVAPIATPTPTAQEASQRSARLKGSIKDLQIFYNSLQNALHILETAGISGSLTKTETDDEVTVTVTLTKAAVVEGAEAICFT